MKKIKYLYTSLLMMAIAALCLLDFTDLSHKMPTVSSLDKFIHGGMYFVLSALLMWEYRGRKKIFPGRDLEASIYADTGHMYRLFWAVLLICAVFGGLLEYLQGLTGYRSMEQADLTADVLGGLFAYLIYYVTALSVQSKTDKQA